MDDPSAFWSMAAENDWVCDYENYGPNMFMAQNIGIIINTIIFMQLSDTQVEFEHLIEILFYDFAFTDGVDNLCSTSPTSCTS
jgi:hypothetical protein